MKTYISDIIPKIQRFSKKLDDLTILTNQHWVSIDGITQAKHVYIFRNNNELLISKNGKVAKETWEYLGNQALLIETRDGSFLFKHGFLDQNVMALKLDSTNNYAFFINESKNENDLNTIEDVFGFLEKQYLTKEKGYEDKKTTGLRNSKKNNENETISQTQKKWIENPNLCPGCGCSEVLNLSECPSCGLSLK